MHEFPPKSKDQVTLANWRTSPFNRWAFHHVREVVPSADIPNDPHDVWRLAEEPVDTGGLLIENDQGALGLDDFLADTATDGLVVLHHGRIVIDRYPDGMPSETPHILMSVSKSLLGLLAGIQIERGELAEQALITDYLPELADTAYAAATVRHLLDMRAGVRFDEDYLATSGPIIDYRKATNWNPLAAGDTPGDLRSFYASLVETDGPHGGKFHYVSPNTDLLAWVIERAAGRRYADLLSERLWRPLGAERSAYITVDRLGAPRAAGGVCATARDLARIGQLMVQGGKRGQTQVVPRDWFDDLATNGDAGAWIKGDFAEYFPRLPIRYRSKWYIVDEAEPVFFGLGIHGQYLIVHPADEFVLAKVSSRARALEANDEVVTLRMAARIREFLATGL
jgi:CubicO group peptidase (beta-lactamase class C family)